MLSSVQLESCRYFLDLVGACVSWQLHDVLNRSLMARHRGGGLDGYFVFSRGGGRGDTLAAANIVYFLAVADFFEGSFVYTCPFPLFFSTVSPFVFRPLCSHLDLVQYFLSPSFRQSSLLESNASVGDNILVHS